MDESKSTVRRPRILLPWWLLIRVRVHGASAWSRLCRFLGEQVRLGPRKDQEKLTGDVSTFAYPDLPPVAYPPGSIRNDFPLNASLVADLVQRRFSLP